MNHKQCISLMVTTMMETIHGLIYLVA